MNKQNKIILALAGTLLLSGCGLFIESQNGKKEGTIKTIEEYINETQVETTKVFEKGKHLIKYVDISKISYSPYLNSGFQSINLEIPNGYEIFDIESWEQGSYVYFLINTVDVEVTGILDTTTGKEYYTNPGVPIEQKLTLK